MSTRDDYAVEEWEAIRRAPAEAVIAIEQASPSGLWGRRKERKAAERGFRAAIAELSDTELVAAIVAAKDEEGALLDALRASGESFTDRAVETARVARRAILAKGTQEELEAYATAIITTAESVALATREEGERTDTSRAEALLLTRLAQALGRRGYEPPGGDWGAGGVQGMVGGGATLGGIREIPPEPKG
jgi:hypothetical protein